MAEDIWVVSDGAAGNERQALALARALSRAEESAGEPRRWRLHAHAPWRQAAPRRLPGSERAFGEEFRVALAQPPRLAIGCGRLGALATRLLREAGARVVQILDPSIDPRHWDAIVVPAHDDLRGPNVITLQGSLHTIDDAWLAQTRTRFVAFASLSSPRTVLLIGGPIRNAPLDAAWWQRTLAALRALHAREGGSLSICASRRTPAWLIAAVRRDFDNVNAGDGIAVRGVVWLDASDGENPYAGLLAHADRIVVSPDSVNMLSEASATGADVRIASPELARGKHAAFIASLLRGGGARALDADAPLQPTAVLRELPRVAARVREMLG